jgi:hypothetical protein
LFKSDVFGRGPIHAVVFGCLNVGKLLKIQLLVSIKVDIWMMVLVKIFPIIIWRRIASGLRGCGRELNTV